MEGGKEMKKYMTSQKEKKDCVLLTDNMKKVLIDVAVVSNLCMMRQV